MSEHVARDRGLYAMGNTLERRKKAQEGIGRLLAT
jgi:hypothetical protein